MLLPGCIINAGKVQQCDGFRGFFSLHSTRQMTCRATCSEPRSLSPSCFIGGAETISNLSSASGGSERVRCHRRRRRRGRRCDICRLIREELPSCHATPPWIERQFSTCPSVVRPFEPVRLERKFVRFQCGAAGKIP